MKKKIIYVCDDLMLGGWTSLVAMILELKKRGYDLSVVTLFGKGYNAEILQNNGIKVKCLYFNKFNFLLKILQLTFYFLKEKPDIVHTHLHFSDCFGIICAILAGVKNKIVHIHSIKEKYKHKLTALRHLAYRRLTIAIAVSKAAKENFKIENPFFNGKITILHNGINISEFRKRVESSTLTKEKLGVKKDEFLVLTVANFKWQKGLEYLVSAAEILQNENFKFLIAGYGPEKEKIERMVQQKKLTEKIIFLGPRTDVPELMKTADCFLLPSLVESFGICIIEAFAAGIPVIASSVYGITEIAKHEENALLVNATNQKEICEALQKIKSDAKLRAKITSNALIHSQNFEIAKIADKMQKIYDKLN